MSGATTPVYDAAGYLTTDEAGRQLKYDAWGRLVEVKNSGGTILASYKHDGLDRRVSETRGGTTTDLYYSDQWQVLEERVGGTVKAQYVWSPVYVNALILRDRDADGNSGNGLEERLWAHQDANWNVTALLDGSGNVVERYAYDAFGGVTVYDANWIVRTGGSAYAWVYLWQGMRLDPATGLYMAGYRDVSTSLGRPVQPDPLGFAAGDVNVYRWEGNMPVAVTDPSGLMFTPDNMKQGSTPEEAVFAARLMLREAHGNRKLNPWGFLPWADDEVPIEDEEDPALWGGGTLRRGEIGPAIKESLEEFGDFMKEYGIEVGSALLFGPVLGKAVAAALNAGWKLVKIGGKFFLKKGNKACEIACFAAGTPVLTPNGSKPIEDIRPGDVVLARAEDDPAAPVQARVVEDVFRRSAPVLGLVIGGHTIRLSEEHPFYTLSRGWTKAYELRAGDWVLGKNGEWLPIGAVERAGDPVVVYNMRVGGAHTFFVGRENWGFAIWVHNAPKAGPCDDLHHSDPMFMGGAKNQNLTPMPRQDHKDLHNDLNDLLYGKKNAAGQHMRPQPGNSGRTIRRNFTRDERLAALAEFYKKFGDKYPAAARDFFAQHPHLR